MGLDVLLVEPWHAGSHAAWATAYVDGSRHRVRTISHPGRFWRWRMRGAAVTLAEAALATTEEQGPAEVVLVSGMVDLAQLRGLAGPALDVPVVLYLHENQVAYPHDDATDLDAAWRTWTSLLAADAIVINSAHHRDVLVDGLGRLLATAPDLGHEHLLDGVVERIEVLPVGVSLPGAGPRSDADPPTVIWNHRWDGDKQPDVFVRAIESIAGSGVDVRVVLAGEDDWDGAPRRRAAQEQLGDLVAAAGPFNADEYHGWLRRSDVVVSAARHEFFGVAVVEAIAAGCVPVLPDALAYPEIIPRQYHHAVLYPEGGFRRALESVLRDLAGARRSIDGLADAMAVFDHRSVAARLDATLEMVVAAHR